MDVEAVRSQVHRSQHAMAVLATLNLTSYLWPEDKGINFDDRNTGIDVGCYDFIIIGLGTAGCILANRLTKDEKFKVLGIENGGDPPFQTLYPGLVSYLPNSTSDWNFTSNKNEDTAQQHRGNVFELTSGNILGGDSSIGHMIYVRGDRYDYNKLWVPATKDRSWNYEHLLSYMKISERLEDRQVLNSPNSTYGTDGNMGLSRQPSKITKKYLKAFAENNKTIVLDTNGNNTKGFAEPMLMISEGQRQSMALTFLSPVKDRKNLDVFLNTKVTKILIDGKNRAFGIQAKRKNGKIIIAKAKREILLCAGTIKSPQLLMLSGIGRKELLRYLGIPVKADSPVGKNFQDHVGVVFAEKFNITNSESMPFDPRKFSSPLFVGNLALDENQQHPDYQAMNFIIPSDSKALITQTSILYSFKDNVCQSLYDQTKGYETMFTKLGKLHPISRGEVLLNSTDPEDDPIIKTGYFSNEKDLEDTVDYIVDFLKVQNTSTFKKYNAEFVYPDLPECDKFNRGSRKYLLCYARNMKSTTYHYSSTCSIGLVVDNRLRVYGVKRLRVVDASVMPYTTSGNIQAPVMAIAHKGADMIIKDNQGTVRCSPIA